MTKKVRFENADTGNAPIRISQFMRGKAGDSLVGQRQLDGPTQLSELLLTRDTYYVIEEAGAGDEAFRQRLAELAEKDITPGVDANIARTCTAATVLFQTAEIAARAPNLWLTTNLQSTPAYAGRYNESELAFIRLNTGCADDGTLKNGVFGQGFVQADSADEGNDPHAINASPRVFTVRAAPVPGGYTLDFDQHVAAAAKIVGTNGNEPPVLAIRANSWADLHAGIARYLNGLARKG